jgi:acyl carrier protein
LAEPRFRECRFATVFVQMSSRQKEGIGIWNRFPYVGLCFTDNSKDMGVTATFDKVADIIAETSEIERENITPESHTIDDLGIDSLDFLDIVFAIDKEFGIKIPLEQWTQDVNEGKVSTEEYFVLKNLCAKIDELRAAKA